MESAVQKTWCRTLSGSQSRPECADSTVHPDGNRLRKTEIIPTRQRFKDFEKNRRWNYYAERLRKANELGYDYLIEAIVFEYRRLKSFNKVAKVFGLTSSGIQAILQAFGEPRNSPGGYREGDKRGCRKTHLGPKKPVRLP